MPNAHNGPSLRFYGRRKGRPLRARKRELIETLLPQIRITLQETVAQNSRPLTLQDFFPHMQGHAAWLEIGFGGGEHLVAQAAKHPDIGFIGCEPFINGIASLCAHIDARNLRNIRIFPDDARALLDILPDASINRCFLLFPDPWPKARHAERRFINPDNVRRLARVLRYDAELHLATDDKDLAEWMRTGLSGMPAFRPVSDGPTPPPDWTPTRYEQKAIKAGRKPVYMVWRRV